MLHTFPNRLLNCSTNLVSLTGKTLFLVWDAPSIIWCNLQQGNDDVIMVSGTNAEKTEKWWIVTTLQCGPRHVNIKQDLRFKSQSRRSRPIPSINLINLIINRFVVRHSFITLGIQGNSTSINYDVTSALVCTFFTNHLGDLGDCT